MNEIIYDPQDVGKEVSNAKGKVFKLRKYHLTDSEMSLYRKKWDNEVLKVNIQTRRKSGDIFFNPYRQGIYYYQIQTLFLLGANEWHSLSDIISKLEEYSSSVLLRRSVVKKYGHHTAWDQFRGRRGRLEAKTSKDYVGRMQENFIMLQRLSQMHPYGYKLHQVFSAIDIKRISRKGFSNGLYFYRLSTYPTQQQAFPIKDFSNFTFPQHETRYVSKKFIGTIVTKDRVIVGSNQSPIESQEVESQTA